MFGAIISGRLADYFGRKRVSADDTDDTYLQTWSLKWLIKDKKITLPMYFNLGYYTSAISHNASS